MVSFYFGVPRTNNVENLIYEPQTLNLYMLGKTRTIKDENLITNDKVCFKNVNQLNVKKERHGSLTFTRIFGQARCQHPQVVILRQHKERPICRCKRL